MKKKTPVVQRHVAQAPKFKFSEENEGIAFPVQIERNDGIDLLFTADLNSLPAPGRKFTADAFSIVLRDDVFHLIFAQRRIGGSQLRAMVDVQMSELNALSFARTLFVNEVPPNTNPLGAEPLHITDEPEQTATVSATMARGAAGPTGACIDFYFASAYSVRAMQNQPKLYLEPEVRIVTNYTTYLGFSASVRTKAGLSPLASGVEGPLGERHGS